MIKRCSKILLIVILLPIFVSGDSAHALANGLQAMSASTITTVSSTEVVLGYDTGNVGATQNGIYVGVKFSLPVGVTSAKLLAVRFSMIGTDNLEIHVTGSNHRSELIPPLSIFVTAPLNAAASWNDVDLSDYGHGLILYADFYVVIHVPTSPPGNGAINCDDGLSDNKGRSFYGSSLDDLANPLIYSGVERNYLIRAVILPVSNQIISFTSQVPSETSTVVTQNQAQSSVIWAVKSYSS